MKYLIYLFVFILIVSCKHSNNKIQLASESFPMNDISIGSEINDSDTSSVFNKMDNNNLSKERVASLFQQIPESDSIKTKTDLDQVILIWKELKKAELDSEISFYKCNDSTIIRNWYRLNLELLKLNGDPIYTNELEKLFSAPLSKKFLDENSLKQLVFTKMDDQVYVNLFTESAVQYEHTTGGTIRISQETKYPHDERVTIRLETSDKRFVELFIFIPSWAEKATVTVGGVKYKAVPGEYCQVAKMWKSGNSAEIYIEHPRMPI